MQLAGWRASVAWTLLLAPCGGAATTSCPRADALDAAVERLAIAPDDPAALASMARRVMDPHLARARIEAGLARHPGDPTLLLSLGIAARREGDLDRARSALVRAQEDPMIAPDALDQLATVEAAAGDARGALRAARSAYAGRPTDPRLAWRLAVFADRAGEARVAFAAAVRAVRRDPRSLRARRTAVALAVRHGSPRALAHLSRVMEDVGDAAACARLTEARGDTRGAFEWYRQAGYAEPWVARRMRGLALAVGDGRTAWQAFASPTGEAALLDEANTLASAFVALRRRLVAGAGSWRSLEGVDALLAVGWIGEAQRLARGLEVAGVDGARERAEGAARLAGVVAALDEMVGAIEREPGVTIDTVAARTAAIVGGLGRPVTPHVARLGPLAAWFGPGDVTTAEGDDPLATRAIVWHAGRAPDGWTVLRAQGLVHLRAGIPGDPGAASTFWLIDRANDEPAIDGGQESLEGVTTPGGDVFLDADAASVIWSDVAGGPGAPVDEARAAATEAERLDVGEPLCVSRRVLTRAAREEAGVRMYTPDGLGPVFASILEHERGHLTDHRAVQPPWRHPLRAAALAARAWWSGLGLAAEFERRAELRALANSPAPLTALGLTLRGLDGEPWDDPHRRAYRAVVRGLVEAISREGPARYGLDPDRNLLQQLDRLSGTAVHALAAGMLSAEGLDPGRPPGPVAHGGLAD